MRLFQYQRLANPIVAPVQLTGTILERSTPDKWIPAIDAPQSSWRPAVAAACVIAAATAFCFVAVPSLVGEEINVDDWHPQIEQPPKLDVKRQQQLYPELGLGPYPVPASVSGWQPQTNQPIFDQKRLQYNYPTLSYTPLSPLLERVSLDKFHPPTERPLFDQKRTQYLQVQADCRGNIPLVFLFAGNWHPVPNQPVFDARRQQQTFPDQSAYPLPIPAPVSGWHPPANQPLFDQRRLQYLYPAESRDDIAGKEHVSPDRWMGIDPPLFDARRQQAIYPSEFRGDIPRTEVVSADRWHPVPNQPVFDAKRQQATYPCEARDDIAGKELIKVDEWLPLGNQPLFDVRRQQQTFPSWTADQLPRTEIVSTDRWQPLANQPLFDKKRAQATYPCEARDDIAGKERVSPDKWHLEIQRPLFLAPRSSWNYEASTFAPLPVPPATSGWQPQTNQPVFDQKRTQAIYPAEFRGDVPRTETITPDDWHPLPNQPLFTLKRQQQTYPDAALNPYLVPAQASGWMPASNQPLFDQKRLQHLYPAESRDDIAGKERVSPDRWLGVDPPLFDVRRQQALYPSEFRGDTPRTETITPDDWHPAIAQPLFDVKRQQHTYRDAALNPYLVPAQASGWMPAANQPLFDVRRTQAIYPAEFRGDVPRTERITPDKWHPEIQRPIFLAPRSTWIYPSSAIDSHPITPAVSGWHPEIQQPLFITRKQQQSYPDQSLNPLATTPPTSAWQPDIRQPLFDQKRTQYLAAGLFYADIPRIETLYERSWQAIEQPRFDLKRQQYLYPSVVADTLPRKETVSIDRWHPSIERVLFDPRRAYRSSNEASYSDIPRNSVIGPDRWTPSAELPRVLPGRVDHPVSAFVSVPPPVVTWIDAQVSQIPVLPRFRPFDTPSGLGDIPRREHITLDKWHPPLEQPIFSKPYFQWAYNAPPFPFLASIAPPAQRLQIIAPDVRIFPIYPETRIAIAGPGGPVMQMYMHSQNEILDYGWDWSQWLEAIGDYIVTSTWIVPSGINQTNASIVSGTSITSVFLQGNKMGAVYTITNRILTGQGRTAEQSFKLTIGTV